MNGEQPVNDTDAARTMLGDTSKEDAAANVQSDLNLIAGPEQLAGKKRGRKPKSEQQIPEGQPTPAQVMFGEACVKTQSVTFEMLARLVAEQSTVDAIHKSHMETHRAELAFAYANLAKEYGYDVTGKIAAFWLLASAEIDIATDCWEAFVPKQKPEEKED